MTSISAALAAAEQARDAANNLLDSNVHTMGAQLAQLGRELTEAKSRAADLEQAFATLRAQYAATDRWIMHLPTIGLEDLSDLEDVRAAARLSAQSKEASDGE